MAGERSRPSGRVRGIARDYLLAGRWRAAALRPAAVPEEWAGGDRRPVLLIPGVWEPWQFLRPLGERLSASGHPVHVVTAIRHNSAPVPVVAGLVADHLAQHDLRDVVVVAHSKGGLIGKRVMLGPSGWRVARLVAIATPFSGSEWGRVVPLRAVRALAPESPDVVSLAAETAVNARITSIYPLFDPHVPGGSELPGAENVRLPIAGHSRILADPIALRAVGRAVAGAAEDVQREADAPAARDR
jgi:hypothetical protein